MIKFPDFIKPFPSQPNDPPNCKNFAALKRDSFNLFLRYFPILEKYANPYDERQVIDETHRQLEEDQGLIEVEKGTTKKGLKYIAVITKSYMGQEYGVQYFLRINVFDNLKYGWVEEIDAFFGEEGAIGQRDAIIMAAIGMPKDWMQDPYDNTYTKGIRMNKSEDKRFDSKFPYHPLSQARQFLTFIKESN